MASWIRSTNEVTARQNSEQRVLSRLEKWTIPDLAQLVYDYTGDAKEDVPHSNSIAMAYNENCCVCGNDDQGIVFGTIAQNEVRVTAPECERCEDRGYGCETEFEEDVETTHLICKDCIEKLLDLTKEFGGRPCATKKKKRTFSQVY